MVIGTNKIAVIPKPTIAPQISNKRLLLESTEGSSYETVGEDVEEEVRNAIANEMERILASSNYEYPEPPIAPRKRWFIFPLWIRVSVSISVLFFIGAVCRELMISLL